MSSTQPRAFEFGPYRLEVEERLLLRGGEVVRLTPKAFDTLALLVRRGGHLLSKEELIRELWPDAHVEENNLAQYISLLRRTLEDSIEGSAYIETVPRVGYRFVAAVRELNDAQGQASAAATSAAPAPEWSRPAAEIREPPSALETSWLRRHSKALILGAAALALAVYAALGPVRALVHPPPPVQTLAVLPFQVSASDAEAPALGLTFAADLIDRLALSTPGHPLPISGVYRFLGASTGPLAAGRDLHADAVLYGRLQKKDAVLTEITAKVIRVADGRELWSETRTVPASQLSDAEAHIADRVARALAWKREAPSARQTANTASFEAREAYVMGRYLWNTRSAEGLFRGTALLERAVSLAPQEALFRAGLADARAFDLGSWPRAEDQARAALELDKSSGEAHASLGFIRLFWQRDRDAAESEFKQAIQLRPQYATAHQWYALALATHGSFGAAQAEIHQARQLDPYSLPILSDECHISYLARQFDSAQAACQEVLRVDPNFLAAHETLLEIYELTAKGSEALDEYFRIRKILGGLPSPPLASAEELRRGFEQAGLPGFWRAETRAIEKLARSPLAPPLRLAQDYARLNNKEAALAWLDRLAVLPDLDALFVWYDPVFDSLHSDPRFDAIDARIFTPRRTVASASPRQTSVY